MLPLISFKTGRKTQTQSSGRGRNGCASKWKSGSSNQKEPRPRGQHTRRKNLKEFTPALLRSASGEFCSLDKDLSWKSGYRRCGFCEFHFSGYGVYRDLGVILGQHSPSR